MTLCFGRNLIQFSVSVQVVVTLRTLTQMLCSNAYSILLERKAQKNCLERFQLKKRQFIAHNNCIYFQYVYVQYKFVSLKHFILFLPLCDKISRCSYRNSSLPNYQIFPAYTNYLTCLNRFYKGNNPRLFFNI